MRSMFPSPFFTDRVGRAPSQLAAIRPNPHSHDLDVDCDTDQRKRPLAPDAARPEGEPRLLSDVPQFANAGTPVGRYSADDDDDKIGAPPNGLTFGRAADQVRVAPDTAFRPSVFHALPRFPDEPKSSTAPDASSFSNPKFYSIEFLATSPQDKEQTK